MALRRKRRVGSQGSLTITASEPLIASNGFEKQNWRINQNNIDKLLYNTY